MPKPLTNLNAPGLRQTRRRADPMRAYDALPAPLRSWMAQAALPWSPHSCHMIWKKTLASGASQAEALARLTRAEQATLAKDRQSSRVILTQPQ